MWMLALVAGALLERARPALEAVRPQAISATVRFLSDDLLERRGTGTRGHPMAEQYVAAQMQALGPVPEQNFFSRSDQLSFARIGVPSACLWQGFSGARGEAAFKDYRAHRYHQPGDEWLPSYDWDAAAQMARVELLVGVSLLAGPRPKWKPDSPFR